MPATYTLIASNTLTSSSASVTFSSIPGTYTDLVLRASVRNDAANARSNPRIEFNSDSSTNYSLTEMYGFNGSASSARVSNDNYVTLRDGDGGNATSNTFSNLEVYIPSYTVSQNKPFGNFGASEDNSTTTPLIGALAGLWRNTAAITTIKITIASGSMVSGSSFFLYGIKNA